MEGPEVHIEERREEKDTKGHLWRSKAFNHFLTRTIMSPHHESTCIQDKVKAEDEDKGSSAAPHHQHHQVPMGIPFGTCGVRVFGCTHP